MAYVGGHLNTETTGTLQPGYLGLFRAFWHHAAGRRRLSITSNLMLVSSQLVKLTIPWLAAQAINAIQTGNGSLQQAGVLMGLILLASIAAWALHGPGRIIERSVGIAVREKLADDLYARLARLPLAWHERHHSGETLHRVDRTTQALSDFAQNQFIYLQNTINIIGPLVALALLSGVTGGIALAGYVLIAAVIVRFDQILTRLVALQNAAERRYAATLVDCLGNMSTVISLRLQHATRRLLAGTLAHVFVPLRRNIVLTEAKWCLVDLLTLGLTWGLVAFYAWHAHAAGDAVLLGNVFMIYQYAGQAGGVVGSIASNFQNFARMRTDYASADPIWAAAPAASPHALPEDWQHIAVSDLHFDYTRRRGEASSLDGVSIAMRRGQRIALVGPSGSGKSTLMRVLAGLYEPHRGRYAIDGATRLDTRTLAPIATLIPQDAEVFEATVRENITFGEAVDGATLAEVIRLAALDAVIAGLPAGLDTVLSERGVNLSGGQKQRIALARGLFAARRSSVLLLDEPTSSLDPATEAAIFAGLRSAIPDACVIASVHRLNLLPQFDAVVLMANGRVLDTGSVLDLLERQPLFRELWARSTGAGNAQAA